MMQSGKIMGLFAAITLVACNASNQASLSVPTQESTEAAPSANRKCPSQDFTMFLDAFLGSADIQKRFTASPLQSDSIDVDAEPEPKQVTAMIYELQFPVIPNKQDQVNQGLVMSTSTTGNETVLKMTKPDSDYQVSYYFKRDACWTLYRKNDESI